VKKILLSLIIALVLVISFGLPALANGSEVETGVTVTQSGGDHPIVKCKWETPDDDPIEPYTQVDPACTFQGKKTVTIWVVIGDTEDNGVVAQVVADIYHPEGPPKNGSIKYSNVRLTMVDKFAIGIPQFKAANTAGLIYYASGHDYASVLEQLNEGVAQVWKAEIILDYCQPAGDYKVEVVAVDKQSNYSEPFANTFEYVACPCIEIDFTSVTYPNALTSSHVWRLGDTMFGTSDKPTVRNIGNTNGQIQVIQNDMGFGKYPDEEWKVEFDARLGPDTGTNTAIYDPEVLVTLPGILPLCNTQKLDFSIHIKYGVPGTYTGTMTISCIISPF
jgi:hypothetical protein